MTNIKTNREQKTLKSNSPLLELPPEIRNQIMRLVLCPGHVYLHQKLTVKKHLRRQKNPRMRRQETLPARVSLESKSANSGPDVLATCRQLYQEWHAFYYSSNVFHIPTSSIMIMKPCHRALIRHVGLRLSLLDVIPSKTEDIETLARDIKERAGLIRTSESEEYMIYPRCCAAVLLEVWLSSISSFQESFPGLKTICIEIPTQAKPQRLLRLKTPAKNFNSWIGYQFKFLDDCLDSEFTPLGRKYYEKHRLDVDTGFFLDFAAQQAYMKVYCDMSLKTGTWANFKDSVDADTFNTYDETLGIWGEWKERINAITETVQVV